MEGVLINHLDTQTSSLTIPQLFEKEVIQFPERIGLVCNGKQLSYDFINRKANQIAHCFLNQYQLKPGEVVGVFLDSSEYVVISMLAILKCACTYLPLDSRYPVERLLYMIEDADAKFILTDSVLKDRVSSIPCESVLMDTVESAINKFSDHNPSVPADVSDPAYIMYTSGTTGKPNGVVVAHKGIIRLVKSDYIPFTEELTFLQLAPVGFDASTFEIWGALLTGNRLVIYPEVLPEFQKLGEIIRENKVTCLWLTATLFNLIIDEAPEMLQGVSYVLTGGEALSVPHVKLAQAIFPDTQFVNGYGPTECTTFACCYPIPDIREKDIQSIPIGKSIAQTSVFILDKDLKPVPQGEEGELYIAGDGLAIGYLNKPELTASRFITLNELSSESIRLYKTGDLCRELPDGMIEYVCRIDHQVKIHGFRIEIAEIELAMLRNDQINNCIVLVTENEDCKHLSAYITTVKESDLNTDCSFCDTIDEKMLKDFLMLSLPSYMIPAEIIKVTHFPTTVNGKIDRVKLRALREGSTQLSDKSIDLEKLSKKDVKADDFDFANKKLLLEIWKKVFKRENIGTDDNFFELGGHSLLGMKLVHDVNKAFKTSFAAGVLFRCPTIDLLAQELWSDSQERLKVEGVVLIKKGYGKPLFMAPGGLLSSAFSYFEFAKKIVTDRPLYVMEYPKNEHKRLPMSSLNELAAYFIPKIKEIQPNGPYHFLGYSLGARVVFEMALQLQDQNNQIGFLGIVDTSGFYKSYFTNKTLNSILEEVVLIAKLPFTAKKKYFTDRVGYLLKNKLKLKSVEVTEVENEADGMAHFYDCLVVYGLYKPASIFKGNILLVKRSLNRCETIFSLYYKNLVYPDLYFSQNITGSVHIKEVDCEHGNFLGEPHVSVFASIVQPYI
jgi:amino acid adenylation domain-containing protein